MENLQKRLHEIREKIIKLQFEIDDLEEIKNKSKEQLNLLESLKTKLIELEKS